MAEKDSKKPNKTESGSPPQSDSSAQANARLSGDADKESGIQENDPFEPLSADYEETKRLFEEYEKTERLTRKSKIVEQICSSFIVHATLEEEILYPACRELVDDQKIDEAQVENDSAKTLVNELIQGSPRDPFFDSKVKVLAEQFKAHIEHERNWTEGLFVTSTTDAANAQSLAEKLRSRRKELISLAQAGSLPRVKLVALSHLAAIEDHKEELMGQVYRDDREQSRNYDDDRRRSYSRGENEDYRSRSRNTPERDEQGRFMSEEESRRSRGRGYGEDDDRGRRYASDEDRRSSRGRSEEDDDRSYRSRGGQSTPPRDDQGRFMSEDERRYGSSQSRQSDDDYRHSREGHGGWFGDPRGHSEASRRGWDHREGQSGYGRDNDERRYSESSGRGHGGWFGDPEGHAQAARRGWDERENEGRNESRSARYSRDEDDDRRSSRSSGRSGHGGWFGDPEGHSEASRRGWEDRR